MREISGGVVVAFIALAATIAAESASARTIRRLCRDGVVADRTDRSGRTTSCDVDQQCDGTCSFELEASIADPAYVLIETAGQARAFQSQNGWTLGTDKKTVTLTGAACESVRSGAAISVEVQCTPVVLL